MPSSPRYDWDTIGRRSFVLAVLFVVALTWLPRGLALDRVVTPDEPLWLGRSANFYQALAHANLSETYQYVHPGVTAMWLGTLGYLVADPGYGPRVAQQIGGQQEFGTKPGTVIADVLGARGVDPLQALASLRTFMVIANTLALCGVFIAAWRVFGPWVALLGSLLIAFDPFNIALSRLMHLDALASNLMLLSLLLFFAYVETGQRWRDLIFSGVVAGLAWLTRSATGVLVPFVALLTAGGLALRWRAGRAVDRGQLFAAAGSFMVWCLVGLATFVALWPAMWVAPMETIRKMALGALGLASEDQSINASFFNGAIHQGDPGWLFYPVTYLWRTTPAVLIGLILAAVCWVVPRLRASIRATDRRTLLALLLFVALYGLVVSVAGKKYDRYLLPVYGPLTLVAAWGWVQVSLLLGPMVQRAGLPSRAATWLTIGAVSAGQMLTALPAFPYFLSYYNPLPGGTVRAVDVVPVGWGEGLDQVAYFLNRMPDAESLTVAVAAPHRTLDYFFDGVTLRAEFPGASTADDESHDPLLTWAKSDFYALYVTNRQEGHIPQPFLDYFAALSPLLMVRLQGLDYAKLYDIRTAPLPEAFLGQQSPVTDWGGTIRLVANELNATRLQGGEPFELRLYLQTLDQQALNGGDPRLEVSLMGEDGRELMTINHPVAPPEKLRTIWPVTVVGEIPEDAKPGDYRVKVSFRHGRGGPALDWTRGGVAMEPGTPLEVGTIRIARASRDDDPTENSLALPEAEQRGGARDSTEKPTRRVRERREATPVPGSPQG